MNRDISPDLETAVTALEERQKSIKTRAVDIRKLKVLGDNKFSIDGIPLYIDQRSTSQNDVIVDELPTKQLCSLIGMGLGFYRSNPNGLNSHIFERRLAGLEDDDTQRMIRYRETEKGNRLLAILPMVHQAPNYADVMGPLRKALPSNSVLRMTNHASVDDDHRLSLRISLLDYPIRLKEQDGREDPAELGFFVDLSEDGRGGKARLTSMVYNQTCSNGAMVTYDSHPYFEYNYRGIRTVDLGKAIQSAIDRFGQDVGQVHSQLMAATQNMLTKNQALGYLKGLEARRDVSIGFIRKVRKDLDETSVDHISKYRVVNNITQFAQRLSYDGRVQHEFAAGNLLGLDIRQAA